jgi:hypothetical protein
MENSEQFRGTAGRSYGDRIHGIGIQFFSEVSQHRQAGKR